ERNGKRNELGRALRVADDRRTAAGGSGANGRRYCAGESKQPHVATDDSAYQGEFASFLEEMWNFCSVFPVVCLGICTAALQIATPRSPLRIPSPGWLELKERLPVVDRSLVLPQMLVNNSAIEQQLRIQR